MLYLLFPKPLRVLPQRQVSVAQTQLSFIMFSSCFHPQLSCMEVLTLLCKGFPTWTPEARVDTSTIINHHQPQNEDGNNMQQLSRSQGR